MKRILLTAALTALAVVALAAGVGLLVIYTGAYNVAATKPHAGITRWALNTLQQTSVSRRAGEIEGAPPADSAALASGFHHFRAMCVQCHGAPGHARGELGQGMRPRPPRLKEQVQKWTDAELFWIVKHGIRLAGMPAFGPTHSDEDLWAIVAFTRSLADMSEEQYARLVGVPTDGMGGAGEQGRAHSHAAGTASHSH